MNKPPLQIITLLARRKGGGWCTRQRFSDQHSDFRAGKLTLADFRLKALSAVTAWERVEPETEFKLEINL